MSSDAREISLAGGKPVRLYLFERGASTRWAYNSSDRDITYQGIDYLGRAISDDGIRQSGQSSADALEVTGPATLDVAQLYRGAPPSDEISLTIRDLHYGEADALVRWSGSIGDVNFPAQDRCQIRCESLAASMAREGLRLSWERNCPHALGDRLCRVDMELYAVAGTVITLDGISVSATAWAGYPDGWFDGGWVQWPVGGGEFDRRGIETQVGGLLTLLGGSDGIALADALTAYPGCLRTIAICQSKFANEDNYGGVPGLPGRSPFDGDPVF
ncbi:MAG: DUF2163 domain-containing protein [Kordiimonadaceae bacterium]|nr:DUF2163 domain-containing protein [Kordiimonadaceae bacterium]PCJ37749.1 MAG: hypothetical protein COA75_03240 [Cellvibrionales bacterium]